MANDQNMFVHERQILPGMTLTVCPTDRFKVGALSLSFVLPLDRALAPKHSLLLSVLRRGCEAYPNLAAINRRLDELYATPFRLRNSSKANVQCIGFSADLLERRFLPPAFGAQGQDLSSPVLCLMEQMLFHPLMSNGLLSEHYVANEKKNTQDAIRSIANHPSAYAMMRFSDLFYEREMWGHLLCGNEQEVERLTVEQLSSFRLDMLQTAPVRCFYVGGMHENDIAEHLRRTLMPSFETVGRSERSVRPLPVAISKRPPLAGQVRRVEEEHEAGQSHLILGFRTGITLGSPQFYAMMMCHEILGVSPISRLFVHVREAHGLCYSCSSEYYVDRGDLVICCGISAENRERAETAILQQIEAMRSGAFSDAEWEAAKKSIENGYRQIEDSTRLLANFYELRSMLGIRETVSECASRLQAVTREQVIEAAEHIALEMVYFRRGLGTCDDMDDEEVDEHAF